MVNIKRPSKKSTTTTKSSKFYYLSIVALLFSSISFGTYIFIRSSSLYKPSNYGSVAGVNTQSDLAQSDLVTEISKNPNYKIFFDAITRTEIFKDLKEKGPFTVLVPHDSAFNQLGKASLDQYFNNKEALKNLILNHIIPYKIEKKDLISIDQISSVNQKVIKINISDLGTVFNNAKLMSSGNNATNGIFYEVNAVIL